ncbi:endonuclease/exonuclease/phosphatase family protein [Nesterenkonia lutea]
MSWNIRRRTGRFHPRAADRWNQRAPGLRALLRAERPTLLGAQEALEDQSRFICASLGASYQYIGHGRSAGGGGEGCPIFYDADRLELLGWEQSALSETPDRPGSRSWGNVIPRVLVSARFRDRETSASFLALNTHLDHLSSRSRLASAQAIRDLAAAGPLPAVLTADLNTHAGTAAYRALVAGEALADTRATAERHDSQEWGTFANYRTPRRDRPRIDRILTTPGVRVTRAAVNTQRHGAGWASDHLPVHAVIVLPEEGASP